MASLQSRGPHGPYGHAQQYNQHHPMMHHHQSSPSTYIPNGSIPMGMPPPVQHINQLPPINPIHPGVAGLPPNARMIEKQGVRVLCIADVRGNLRQLNDLAKQANADHVIHTGDFGFYDASSLERIAEKTLRHVAQYSPLLTEAQKKAIQNNSTGGTVKQRLQQLSSQDSLMLSELPLFLDKTYTLDVPVYTVWGACEDVRVLEKFRSGEYKIDKLHIIDEMNSRLLDVGGVKLRLLGLGGAVVMHKLFDNGEGRTTIAGGQGTMWTTLLQMGELVDTANRVYDPTETRLLVTHASPAREGLLNQLAVTLKADFSISGGLHFRYGSSYNEFSVNPTMENYRGKLASSKASFNDVWETVKQEVMPAVGQNPQQQALLDNALSFIEKMPTNANGGNPFGGPSSGNAQGQIDESAFKNMWNFNLADAAFGYLVLEIEGGRIGTEMRAQGFNFAHRTGIKPTNPVSNQMNALPTNASNLSRSPTATTPISPAVPQYNQSNSVRGRIPSQQPSGHDNSAPSASAIAQDVKTLESYDEGASGANGSAVAGTEAPPAQAASPPTQKPPSPTMTPQSPVQRPEQRFNYDVEKKKRGLFINNVNSEDEVRAALPAEDASKIVEIVERRTINAPGRKYFYVFFETADIAKAVLSRVIADNPGGDHTKPQIKEIYQENYQGGGRIGMNDSKWSRGGDSSSYSRAGGPRGMQGGSASESEGAGAIGGGLGRGRGGGYRRASDKGPRGGFEGGRGGRGGRGRGGRGGFKGEGGGDATGAGETH